MPALHHRRIGLATWLGAACGSLLLIGTSVAQPVAELPSAEQIRRFPRHRYLAIVDQFADPFGHGGNPGAIFIADAWTGRVLPLASDPTWTCPTNLILSRGPWGILDLCGSTVGLMPNPIQGFDYAAPFQTTKIYDAADGLVSPIEWLPDATGSGGFLVDGHADPWGLGLPTGTVFRGALDGNTPLSVFRTGPPLVAPTDLLIDSRGRMFLVDADANPLGHPGVVESAVWQVYPSGTLKLAAAPSTTISAFAMMEIPHDGSPDAGKFLLVDANAGIVSGPFATGAIFLLDLNQPWPVVNTTLITDDAALGDPVAVLHEGPGTVLISDMSADPLGLGYDGVGVGFAPVLGRGCIWRLDIATGNLTVAVASPMFVNPANAFWLD